MKFLVVQFSVNVNGFMQTQQDGDISIGVYGYAEMSRTLCLPQTSRYQTLYA